MRSLTYSPFSFNLLTYVRKLRLKYKFGHLDLGDCALGKDKITN